MSVPFVNLKPQYLALKDEIDKGIMNVLDHGMFIMGPEVKSSEENLAKFTGSKHAIVCSSGTDAAIMAMMALGIGPGDEVITSAFSFIATAETIVLCGAKPVLVDIDPETFNISPEKIEEAISEKTKAIVPVSLYGQVADMDEINALAKKHNLYVIEDGAQSFGARYKDKKSCNVSDIGVTSFFPAKPLGCYGDGGAIFTNNDEWAEALKSIRVHGQSERYVHPRIGVNGRLDSMQCAVINAKLDRYSWEIEQRQKIASEYTKAFKEKGLTTPIVREDRDSVWAQYTLRVQNRESFRQQLQEKGIPTAVHYPVTMADQPAYKEIVKSFDLTESRKAAEEVVSLPMYADMPSEDVAEVIEAIYNL